MHLRVSPSTDEALYHATDFLDNRAKETINGTDWQDVWRADRVVEGARLLSECGVLSSTEGSNPSLSAAHFVLASTRASVHCANSSIG